MGSGSPPGPLEAISGGKLIFSGVFEAFVMIPWAFSGWPCGNEAAKAFTTNEEAEAFLASLSGCVFACMQEFFISFFIFCKCF